MFTACIWYQNRVYSYAVISDDLNHSKYATYTFLKSIIFHFKNNYNIQQIFFFSDNCASQFKSKYCLSNLCKMEEDFAIQAEWFFFCSFPWKGNC